MDLKCLMLNYWMAMLCFLAYVFEQIIVSVTRANKKYCLTAMNDNGSEQNKALSVERVPLQSNKKTLV